MKQARTMNRMENLAYQADLVGLSVYTYSPGDGVTRYRFSFEHGSDYFGCRSEYTALGITEAHTFVNGALVMLRRSEGRSAS